MKLRAPSSLIEILESRIAPATILVGNEAADSNNKAYSEAPFGTVASNASYAAALGASPNTYFLKLSAGDEVQLFSSSGYNPFITVTKGSVVAFFTDANLNGEVDANEISGLSLGNNVSVKISGEINGDVVTNLNSDGSLNAASVNPFAIQSLAVNGGSLLGTVAAGGVIKSLRVVGTVENIYTGSAVTGFTYDFNGATAGGGQLLNYAPGTGLAGADITNTRIGGVDQIIAGDGGAGAKGGSISKLTLEADSNGFLIKAGSGGDGSASKTKGGAGGALSTVFVNGPLPVSVGNADSSDNSAVTIQGGAGGDGFGSAKGGAGGSLKSVFVGYKSGASGAVLSDDFLRDNILLQGGVGGNGASSGAGGGIFQSKIAAATPDNAGTVNELQMIGGAGGVASGGKAGVGGSLSNVQVSNLSTNTAEAATSDIFLSGGAGGQVNLSGQGASGGSVKTAQLTGYQIEVAGGNGSAGTSKGGAGGSVSGITGVNTVAGIVTQSVYLHGGSGGTTTSGNGGAGGSVSGISILDADYVDANVADLNLVGLILTAGAGGASSSGVGGAGGKITNITSTDAQVGSDEATLAITAGSGGAGSAKGGSGGGISKVNFAGSDMNIVATAGNGGAASGNAGVGGGFTGNAFATTGSVNGLDVTAALSAGVGGASSAASGGNGGSFNGTNAISQGAVSFVAGHGGSGSLTVGKSGAGGSITSSAGQSLGGNILMQAGNAGSTSFKASNGGSISKSNVLGDGNVQIFGGDGVQGGKGGSLNSVAFSGGIASDAPTGTVTVQAGAGSAVGGNAGAGGSIVDLNGYVGQTGVTLIGAGNINGTGANGAAGGSIKGVFILGGGGAGTELQILAGNASDANSAAKGAKGGSVTNVTILGETSTSAGVDTGTIIRSIAAGNGGNAGSIGGTGGSITGIHASNLDIGVRQGVNYGYASMGGIFAGVGGNGAANGNVIDVTANAIAAIVAGRSAAPELVKLVDRIYLNGLTVPSLIADGASVNDPGNKYDHYAVGTLDNANFVGGLAGSPTAQDATMFHYNDNNANSQYDAGDTPLDGLIAAATLTSKRNFAPGAFLTTGNTLIDTNV